AGAARRELLAVALILLAAAALRVVYLIQYKENVPFYGFPVVDSRYYDIWAQRIAAGQGSGDKPFYMAPLYPYVLALIYKIAGHRLAVVYILQHILGLASLAAVYALARRSFGHAAGIVAMALMTVYAPLVFLESKLLTETLAVFLNLISLVLLLRALDRPAPLRFGFAGLTLGLSAVCRPNALLTAALLLAWLLFLWHKSGELRRSVAAHMTPLILGIALAVLPVTVRNYVASGDGVLLTTNGGMVLAQGNHASANGIFSALPGFSGSIAEQQADEIRRASEALGRPVKASEASRYWARQAVGWAVSHPADYALLTAKKLLWALHNREARCNYNIYLERSMVPALELFFLPFSALIGLAAAGIVFAFAGRAPAGPANRIGVWAVLLYMLSCLATLLVFSVSSRFRVPAVPALAVFAGFGAVRLVGCIRDDSPMDLVVPLSCGIAVMLVSLVPYPIPALSAASYGNLGFSYVNAGKADEAVVQLEKALQSNPRQVFALVNMGRALALQKRFGEAEQCYRRALHEDPGNREAHYYLGYALASQNRLDEAVQQYKEAVRLDPHYADAYFNLGVIYDSWQRYDDAIASYRTAVKINPAYADAHHNLAVDLYETERYAEAWKHVRLCREHGGTPHPGFVRALSEEMPEVK
ncbi:MAG: tetratricopeptide repeat protein, partial [Armatimonadetes bacterium]|nr:tetratricopeptide repeat protein [Armatimonadota bacterium]